MGNKEITGENELSKKEKLEVFLRLCEENEVSANSVATSLNMGPSGILRIMKGVTKQPHESTVNNLYDYAIENYGNTDKDTGPAKLSDFTEREIIYYIMKNKWKFDQEPAFKQFEENAYYRYKDMYSHSNLEKQILKMGRAINQLSRGEKPDIKMLEQPELGE